jgi:hypothetical protein
MEILYSTRQSSLFDLLAPEFKKSIAEVEDEVSQLQLQLP